MKEKMAEKKKGRKKETGRDGNNLTRKKSDRKQTAPQYGMWSNTVYMLRKAWDCAKSVIVLCIIEAGLAVAANLIRLYVTPTVLNAVETAAPLAVLIRLILIFTAALIVIAALNAYLNQNAGYGRITVRIRISSEIHDKQGMDTFFYLLGDMRNNASFLRTTFEFLEIPNNMYQGSLTVEKRTDRNYEV